MNTMTLAVAQAAVDAARQKAAEIGASISVSVVDEAGRLVLCSRGDGASFSTTDTSFAKAVAAAAFRIPTKLMSELYSDHLSFFSNVPHAFTGPMLPSIGAVPIKFDEQTIGAIGCAGASGEQDHECAAAGAERAGQEQPGKQ